MNRQCGPWIVVASGGRLLGRRMTRGAALRLALKDATEYKRMVFVGYVPGNYDMVWTDRVYPGGNIVSDVNLGRLRAEGVPIGPILDV